MSSMMLLSLWIVLLSGCGNDASTCVARQVEADVAMSQMFDRAVDDGATVIAGERASCGDVSSVKLAVRTAQGALFAGELTCELGGCEGDPMCERSGCLPNAAATGCTACKCKGSTNICPACTCARKITVEGALVD